MEFKKIVSGKDKPQILHLGFRMKWNQGPKGPLNTTYFKCVKKDCKATLATCGDLDGELTLKFPFYSFFFFFTREEMPRFSFTKPPPEIPASWQLGTVV